RPANVRSVDRLPTANLAAPGRLEEVRIDLLPRGALAAAMSEPPDRSRQFSVTSELPSFRVTRLEFAPFRGCPASRGAAGRRQADDAANQLLEHDALGEVAAERFDLRAGERSVGRWRRRAQRDVALERTVGVREPAGRDGERRGRVAARLGDQLVDDER